MSPTRSSGGRSCGSTRRAPPRCSRSATTGLAGVPDEFYGWIEETSATAEATAYRLIADADEIVGRAKAIEDRRARFEYVSGTGHPATQALMRLAEGRDELDRLIMRCWLEARPEHLVVRALRGDRLTDRQELRALICAVFGVSEEDVAALEEIERPVRVSASRGGRGMRHPCFMGCEPRGDDDERFLLFVGADLTSYGHTVDAHTRERYPEDWPHTLRLREQGREFACWHSKMCPDGELTAADASTFREIDRATFERADSDGWPTITDDLTSAAPALAVYVIDPETGPQKVWDSVEGDTEGT